MGVDVDFKSYYYILYNIYYIIYNSMALYGVCGI